jgi:hypothetical protein
MKKNQNKFAIFVAVIVVLLLIWLLRKSAITPSVQEPQGVVQTNALINSKTTSIPVSPTPTNELQKIQAHIEQVKQRKEQQMALAQSPLLYYGKVVDENNQPIAGVQVAYTAHAVNELQKEVFNPGTVTSDERGIFKIDGISGIGLMLQISHPNYYPYPENSTGFDKRSRPKKGYFSDSEENAELFRMHSKGHPVPLVHRVGGINVPLNGAPKTLDLRGADNSQKIGQLIIEATGSPPKRYDQQPFNWDAKITVPGGGLVEYTNYFDFTAPDSGYQESIEFAFPKETVGWTDTISKNYFVKLPSGYARLNIYIVSKNSLFFSIVYDYNPDGSTDLERAR